MKKNGFTLVEILVVLAIIGIVIVGLSSLFNPNDEARLAACSANMEAMQTIVEQAAEQQFPYTPSWEQVLEIADGRWDDHYTYVPNAEDTNNGHGNDLDLCDSGNPGRSLPKRIDDGTCLDIKYIIVCDHNHGDLAKYVGSLDDFMFAFPLERLEEGEVPDMPLVRDLRWWTGKDPNLQKWIGR